MGGWLVGVRAVLMALALATLPALAGCVGPEEEAPVVLTNATPEDNVTAPVAPEELPAYQETNRTEEGVGGEAHAHDYWRGESQVTLFEGPADSLLTPFPREDTSRVTEGYVVLTTVPGEEERPALVFEGAGLVEFTLLSAPAWTDTYRVSYRTASTEWSEPTPMKVGDVLAVEPDGRQVDTPHAVVSQWAWRVEAVGPVPFTQDAGLTGQGQPVARVVVMKAGDAAVWPGHPDFYAESRTRTILADAAGKTEAVLAPLYTAFSPDDEALVPERLVSTGTRSIRVTMNVTSLQATAPVQHFTLQWRTAGTRPDDLGTFQRSNETDGATWAVWTFNVDESMVDSPYQPTSRWRLQAWANTEAGNTYCWSCLPYTLEYALTVVASADPLPPAAVSDAETETTM